jgi:hypothetical protein
MVIAIDTGNGATKAVASGRPLVQFPSLLAAADAAWLAGYSDPPLRVDNALWHVGDEARYEPNPIWPGPEDRLRNPHVVPLVAEALWRLDARGPITLALGLPLRVFSAEAPADTRFWTGRTLALARGDATRTVTVARALVFPQGIAALAAVFPVARSHQRWPAEGLVGLIDVGRGTTELVVVDAPTRTPRLALCTSFPFGVGTAVSQLQRWLQDRVQAPVATEQAERAWLTGRLPWRSADLDAEPGIAQATAAAAGRLAADLQHWWRDQWANLALLILVGASAPVWAPAVQELHPNVWVPPQPAFANAWGYLALAGGEASAAQGA